MLFRIRQVSADTCETVRRLHDERQMSVLDISHCFRLPPLRILQALHAGRLRHSLAGADVQFDELMETGTSGV